MRLSQRVVAGSLAVVALLAGGTWAALTIRDRITYGTVVDESRPTLTVERGDRFSIAVPDRGQSVGDRWTAEATPADAVRLERSRLTRGALDRLGPETSGDGGGTRYFTYRAERSGTVEIRLFNCVQGRCRVTEIADPYSRAVTWRVTIG